MTKTRHKAKEAETRRVTERERHSETRSLTDTEVVDQRWQNQREIDTQTNIHVRRQIYTERD